MKDIREEEKIPDFKIKLKVTYFKQNKTYNYDYK